MPIEGCRRPCLRDWRTDALVGSLLRRTRRDRGRSSRLLLGVPDGDDGTMRRWRGAKRGRTRLSRSDGSRSGERNVLLHVDAIHGGSFGSHGSCAAALYPPADTRHVRGCTSDVNDRNGQPGYSLVCMRAGSRSRGWRSRYSLRLVLITPPRDRWLSWAAAFRTSTNDGAVVIANGKHLIPGHFEASNRRRGLVPARDA